MEIALGSGSHDVLRQLLVALEAIREHVATVLADALVVVGPEGGARRASDVPTNHELNGEWRALHRHCHIRVRDGKHVVGNDVPATLEPELAHQVQHTTCRRRRKEYERRREREMRGRREW